MLVALGQEGVIELSGRAWSFAREMGFDAEIGDQIVLIGFYEADHFEAGVLRNDSLGIRVELREESGRPLWAGGRGKNS
jgi:hypothetical protein